MHVWKSGILNFYITGQVATVNFIQYSHHYGQNLTTKKWKYIAEAENDISYIYIKLQRLKKGQSTAAAEYCTPTPSHSSFL